MLEYIALGMVLDDDMTGYDIKKHIETGIGVFYKASFGSLYPALKRLTEKGCLTMYDKPQGGRQKKFYRITVQGKELFLKWMVSPTHVLDGNNTHLAKVFFFDKLPPDTRQRQLLENKEDFYYKLSTLYYGIYITQATIRWCQHIRARKPLADLVTEEKMDTGE